MKGALPAVIALALLVLIVVATFGFRGHHFTKPPFEIFPDMNYQDKVKDQVASSFFSDGVASRLPIDGTVAEEMPAKIDYWASGKWDATHWGDGIPVHDARDGQPALAVDDLNMARGRERYSIDCAVCHGATGAGNGITSKYGLNGAANYHTDRLRQISDGDLFNTITNGKGQMMGYGYNVTIDDRWRIVMYIRALQRSENASINDASPAEQEQLQGSKKPAATSDDVTPQKTTVVFLDQKTLHGWMDAIPLHVEAQPIGTEPSDITPGGYRTVSGVSKINVTAKPVSGEKSNP
jgi:mono/diheme cytochrome c family protein